jgi:hypothetical protein
MAVNGQGVQTSAFEAALHLEGLFGKSDRARIALVQPMHVENGGLDLTGIEVVDRTTGELGQVTRFTPVDDRAREFALEAMYARPILDGRAQAAGFIRSEAAAAKGVRSSVDHMMGGSLTFRF